VSAGSKAPDLFERLVKWSAPLRAVLLETASDKVPFLAEYLRRSAGKYRQLGVHEYAAGNFDLAVEHFEKALLRTPHDAGLHCDLGQVYLESSNLQSAEEQFRKAANYDPKSGRALKSLALTLLTRNQLSESIYFYLRYLEQNPQDADALVNVGVAFHNQGNYEQALRYFGRAERLEPNNALALQNRANTLYALGKFDQAATILRRALDIEPHNYEVQRLLGMALEASGKEEETVEVYRSILGLDPENALVHREISRLLQHAGRYQEAAEHGHRAAEISERQSDKGSVEAAYWNLGWIYYRLGDLEKSVTYSRKAIEVNPKLFPARFNLALALVLGGRAEEAMAEYEKGISDLSQASDLKYYAIDDLAEALKERKGLPAAEETLRALRKRYNLLKKEQSPRTATTSAAPV